MRRMFNDRHDDTMHIVTIRHDTRAWKAQVWLSFGIAAAL